MPINSLLANTSFDPETITLLASAFETAWDAIKKSESPLAAEDQAASTRELLARRIIEMGNMGERDPQRLADGAIAHLSGLKS
jgi:hypothetical protein